uniref:Uncharacterized protein n=1 Tax=Macaca fascicularis TaxID=9541 RepID=A0A7N9CYE5_MACFA
MGQPGRCLRRCPALRRHRDRLWPGGRLQQRPRLHFQTQPLHLTGQRQGRLSGWYTLLYLFFLLLLLLFLSSPAAAVHTHHFIWLAAVQKTLPEFRKKFFKDLRTIPVTS